MYKLTKFPETRYTMMESHLFDKMPKNGKKVGSAEIVKFRQDLGEWDVKFPLKNITVTMNRLIDKIESNDEEFRILKDDKRTGHHKVEYWVVPKAEALKEARNARRRVNGR